MAGYVSVRLDTRLEWDGSRLSLARLGLASEVATCADVFEASSLENALRELREEAVEVAQMGHDPSGLLHVWPSRGPKPADLSGLIRSGD